MSESKDKICDHCNMSIAIRNPSGYCDHLYYPENCSTCAGTAAQLGSPLMYNPIRTELSDKEYAAIHLKVPSSGTPWLDEMIEASRRDEFDKAVFQALTTSWHISSFGGESCFSRNKKGVDYNISIPKFIQISIEITDALLAASKVKKEGEL